MSAVVRPNLLLMLRVLGQHAQFGLLAGVALALAVPALGSVLRPWLPGLVILVFALAIVRMDLRGLISALQRPQEWGLLALVLCAFMPVTALVYWLLAFVVGLRPEFTVIVLMIAVAPPISSATNFALILGFDAERALVLTLLGKALTPLIGPALFALLLPGHVDLSPLDMAGRLATMVGAGTCAGVLGQVLLGTERIKRNKLRMDGLAVIGMIAILPALLDGLNAMVLADPMLAAHVFGLVIAVNTCVMVLIVLGARHIVPLRLAGTFGLIWGNRNAALYLAALPPDPIIALFVALYQFPMYATPLILRMLSLAEAD